MIIYFAIARVDINVAKFSLELLIIITSLEHKRSHRRVAAE